MSRVISTVRQITRRRRLALLISLAYNLGVLGVFKYFNFFADGLGRLFAFAGWRFDPVTIHVILPMGISFYTFMTICTSSTSIVEKSNPPTT